ncbi:MAG: tRNA (adenosine(37)-N6)-dimethylallyltransferase MiaA [Syntrophales bacterium]|nr:tRNA (adenosine(37)-N6)-dimethylallyltransferase MiaA [Syntrophales bacterium]
MREKKNLLVILGPTASGKTALAARLAFDLKGEIISADSRQVYRGMDIGTGKDIDQYVVNGEKITYHLIDIADPWEEFSVYDFQRLFYVAFREITDRKRMPILVGGTGLYIESVLLGYDLPPIVNKKREKDLEMKEMEELREILSSFKPSLHNTTDWTEKKRIIRRILIEEARCEGRILSDRPKLEAAVFGIRWKRDELRKRISERLKSRLEAGLIEEVDSLRRKGLSWERLDSFGLEYRFVSLYLKGELAREEMERKLAIAIGQLAKRQETWFRRMERRGIKIEWIDRADYVKLKEKVALALQHA